MFAEEEDIFNTIESLDNQRSKRSKPEIRPPTTTTDARLTIRIVSGLFASKRRVQCYVERASEEMILLSFPSKPKHSMNARMKSLN